jgi:hypothetical protein
MAEARAIKSHCQGLQLIMSQADKKKIKCTFQMPFDLSSEKKLLLVMKLPQGVHNQVYC